MIVSAVCMFEISLLEICIMKILHNFLLFHNSNFD